MWYEDKLISLDVKPLEFVRDMKGEIIYVGNVIKTHKPHDDVDDPYFTLPTGARMTVKSVDYVLNQIKIQVGSTDRWIDAKDVELYTE